MIEILAALGANSRTLLLLQKDQIGLFTRLNMDIRFKNLKCFPQQRFDLISDIMAFFDG